MAKDDRTDRVIFEVDGIVVDGAGEGELRVSCDYPLDIVVVQLRGLVFKLNPYEWAMIGAYVAGARSRKDG